MRPRTLTPLQLIRRFVRQSRAATLIEFGLLALPFFAIIGAIMETAIVMLAGQVMDSAVEDGSRYIRTGQAANNAYTLATFRARICDNLFGLFNCDAMKLKVTNISTFGTASLSDPVDVDGNWTISETYTSGAGRSVMFVEAHYKWPVVLNLFGFDLANQPDNSRLLSTGRVFKNEPFD